jgi:hypothetical protein
MDPYIPQAIRYDNPPRVEYVTRDTPTVHRMIDERLDILLDVRTQEPIGFCFYGEGLA